MFVAISGTPGVGKSAIATELEENHYMVLRLDEVAEEQGFIDGEERGTKLVDVPKLRTYVKGLRTKSNLFLVSHYSHLMANDVIVVLRCHPEELRKRLKKRRWPKAKITENVEAEVLDVITIEALERCKRVYELNATSTKPKTLAKKIPRILEDGKLAERFVPGMIDWSEEVMKWF